MNENFNSAEFNRIKIEAPKKSFKMTPSRLRKSKVSLFVTVYFNCTQNMYN